LRSCATVVADPLLHGLAISSNNSSISLATSR
jgi:hypothetical protein